MLVFVFVCDSLVFPVLRVIYLFCLFFSFSIHINTIQVKVYRMGETVRDTQLCIYTTTLRDGFLLCYALFCLSSLRIRMLVFFLLCSNCQFTEIVDVTLCVCCEICFYALVVVTVVAVFCLHFDLIFF